MIESGWSLHFRPYALLWFAAVVLVAALAWWSYRDTIPPTSRRWRVTLRTLRIFALMGVAIVALGPRIDWHGAIERKPRVTVLVDLSESMSFVDALGERAQTVRGILSGASVEQLRSRASVHVRGFDTNVRDIDVKDLEFKGSATALGDALLEQRRRVPPPDRVIVVTDGVNTSGPDPIRAATEVNLPIHVIGVGDPRPQADLRIVGVIAPDIALAGKPMTVTATLENIGLSPQSVTVRVSTRHGVITRRSVDLPPAGRRIDVEMTVTPNEPGVFRATVVADRVPGEIVTQNNDRPFSTTVLKATRRVVVLAGAPSADLSYLLRLLSARDDYSVRLWIAPHGQRRASPLPLEADSLMETDLIIWHDVPPQSVPEDAIGRLTGAVANGAGLLVVPGRYTLPTSLGDALPVSSLRGRVVEQSIMTRLEPDAQRHPVFADGTDYTRRSERWSRLPPLLVRTVGIIPSDAAAILLRGGGDPLAIAGRHGAGRVVVFLGLTYWRWGMVPVRTDEVSPADGLWNAVIRWLGTRQAIGRVRLRSDAPHYRFGEPIRLTAQVFDDRYTPLDGADVRISLDDGALAMSTESRGDGQYAAIIPSLPPGEHAATARATIDGAEIGRAEVEFSVSVVGVEYEQTWQREDVLREIARRTGGSYASSANADSLLAAMPLSAIVEARERTIALGMSPWLLLGIVALLTAEWIGRRVRGLP